jgi:hypothetical protein
MKLVTTEPAINEKYDAEVVRGYGQPPQCGGDIWGLATTWVSCHTSLASLPASLKDIHMPWVNPFPLWHRPESSEFLEALPGCHRGKREISLPPSAHVELQEHWVP